jgi:hypothetical protein
VAKISFVARTKMRLQPRRTASIAAMSILFICIIASNARLAQLGGFEGCAAAK